MKKLHGEPFLTSFGRGKIMKNYISSLIFGLSVALLGTGCSSESPFDVAEDGFSDAQSAPKCSSSQSDKSSRANDGSDDGSTAYYGDSGSNGFDYLTNSKTLHFTLTHYKQIVCTMEDKSSKTCDYSDGDPRVTFEIEFIQSNGSKVTYSTKEDLGKNWFYYDNLGEWNGEKTFTTNVPALTDTIRVCPKVEDIEGFNDLMSSKSCYYRAHVGKMSPNEVVEQSDYNSEFCRLEWEWYLD
jgi:hypothetical protein